MISPRAVNIPIPKTLVPQVSHPGIYYRYAISAFNIQVFVSVFPGLKSVLCLCTFQPQKLVEADCAKEDLVAMFFEED